MITLGLYWFQKYLHLDFLANFHSVTKSSRKNAKVVFFPFLLFYCRFGKNLKNKLSSDFENIAFHWLNDVLEKSTSKNSIGSKKSVLLWIIFSRFRWYWVCMVYWKAQSDSKNIYFWIFCRIFTWWHSVVSTSKNPNRIS